MADGAIATVDKPNVQQLMAKVNDRNLSFGARLNSVGEVMKATAHQMMAALPKHVTPDRMMRVALTAIRKNPKLLECSAASLFGAITEAATYGWEIGGHIGHAYLVPFKDECTLIPGYKGLIDLCRRSGQISTISLEVVHEGDKFSYSLGDDPHINHVPNDRDPKRDEKPISHAYAVVRFRDGGVQRSVWSRERIDAHKEQYSKAWAWAEKGQPNKGGGKKDSFWHTAWPVAAKKTVIRDMIQRGLVPVSAEYRDVADRGLQHEEGEPMDFGTFDIMPEPAAIEGEIGTQEQQEETQDRPQTAEDVDAELLDLARMNIAGANDEQGVEFEADGLLKREMNDATRTAIAGMVHDRKAAIRGPQTAKKQKQLTN